MDPVEDIQVPGSEGFFRDLESVVVHRVQWTTRQDPGVQFQDGRVLPRDGTSRFARERVVVLRSLGLERRRP